MFCTVALSRNAVCPVARMYSSMTRAIQMLSSEMMRMPLSTPDAHAAMVMITATTTSPICTPADWGSPNNSSSPTLSSTTPMPMDAATPKMVPSRETTAAASPTAPLTRLPSSGYRAERMLRGMFQR